VPSRGTEPTRVGEHLKADGNDVANFSNLTSISLNRIDQFFHAIY